MTDNKILVVIDVQNDFVTGSLGSSAAVATIDNICAKIESFDGQVIATQDTHNDQYLNTQEGKNLPIIHCVKDTWGHDIEGSVSAALGRKDSYVMRKSSFGARHLLHAVLSMETSELKEVIFIGLVTDICVISNVLILKSDLPELTITVDASCCAGTTPENHAAALRVMKSCQVNVVGE